jgi:hypothetical protein
MAADQEQVDVDMAGSDADDGGSSSDSDIEMDAAAEQQIMSLEEQLAANPHDYDKHVAVRTNWFSWLRHSSVPLPRVY